MPARRYKTNPAQLLAEGQQIVHTTTDAKYRHKVEMINLVLSGLTPSYLSSYCGDITPELNHRKCRAVERSFRLYRSFYRFLYLPSGVIASVPSRYG